MTGRPLSESELETYGHVPRAIAERARVHRVPFLAPGADGMAIGRHILVKRDDAEGRSTLLAHELVHVAQWNDHGVVGFLRRYVSDYARGLVRLRNHRSAYLDIGYEREARTKTEVWLRPPPESPGQASDSTK